MVYVSKDSHDPYVQELRWVAVLSNQEVIFDDVHPDYESSWTRLRRYCQEKEVDVVRLMLEYKAPAVVHILEDNAEGYYFSRGAGAVWGGPSFKYFIAGEVKGGKAYLKWYMVPEFIVERTEVRNITEDEQKFVIMNSNNRKEALV